MDNETLYAHLANTTVNLVKELRGDIIGLRREVLGDQRQPHLHYEVHKNGKVVNPLNFITEIYPL
jgi:murein DD-endopeptidase MepM/ murein hydrolase activator NlpD